MTELEKTILDALIELDNAVKTMRSTNPKPDLAKLLAGVDALTKELPTNSDPNLLHYLHKKSYEKARLALQGRDSENAEGACH